MKRALAGAIGLAVLLGASVALRTAWPGGAEESSASSVVAPSTSSTPAARTSPAAPARPAQSAAPGPAEPVGPDAVSVQTDEQRRQMKVVQEGLRKNAAQKLEERERRRAEWRRIAEARRAARPPDPNRPPPDRVDPGIGPGIVPGSVKPR